MASIGFRLWLHRQVPCILLLSLQFDAKDPSIRGKHRKKDGSGTCSGKRSTIRLGNGDRARLHVRLCQTAICTQTVTAYGWIVVNRSLVLRWVDIDKARKKRISNHLLAGTSEEPQDADAVCVIQKCWPLACPCVDRHPTSEF